MSSGNLYLTVALTRRRNLASGDPGTYSFTTTSVTNGQSTAPSAAFTIQTLLSDQSYVIEQSTTSTVSNTAAGTISSASASVNSVALSTAVIYTLTFTPVNYIQGMSFKVTLPSDLTITDSTQTCTNLLGFIDATFTCTYTASSREILVAGQFTGASNPGQVSLQMPAITNPSSYGVTNSFLISTFHTVSSANYSIDQVISGLTVDVSCDTTCLTCGSVATSCISCDATSTYKFLLSNQ